QAAQLKAWLVCNNCPPTIKECEALFHKAFAPKGDLGLDQGDISLESQDPSHTQPSATPVDLLVYARSSTHVGNSLITYHPGGDTSLLAVPGCIKYIFGSNGKIFFAVQHQNAASGIDPFHHYPHFPAQVYSTTVSSILEEVKLAWVLSHYMQWQFAPGYIVVLTLSQ
ncbi:hypothetical protein PAXINDRAFT_44725, partial [Paxillus involutus ATCC 200175]